MDEELACQLQAEEEVAEEARQGRPVATVEVGLEAAGLSTRGQLEGLGVCAGQAHLGVAGASCLPAAVAV